MSLYDRTELKAACIRKEAYERTIIFVQLPDGVHRLDASFGHIVIAGREQRGTGRKGTLLAATTDDLRDPRLHLPSAVHGKVLSYYDRCKSTMHPWSTA